MVTPLEHPLMWCGGKQVHRRAVTDVSSLVPALLTFMPAFLSVMSCYEALQHASHVYGLRVGTLRQTYQ